MALNTDYRRRRARVAALRGLAYDPEDDPRVRIDFGGAGAGSSVPGTSIALDDDMIQSTASGRPGMIILTPAERQTIRTHAGVTWENTPLPVMDERDRNDERILAQAARLEQAGQPVPGWMTASTTRPPGGVLAKVRARRDPAAAQAALERLASGDVVTGGQRMVDASAPGGRSVLGPGETLPTDYYLRHQREERARIRASETGKVQYVAPPPGSGDIARYIHPARPVTTEIKGTADINLRPADKFAYEAKVRPLAEELNSLVLDLRADKEWASTDPVNYLRKRLAIARSGERDAKYETEIARDLERAESRMRDMERHKARVAELRGQIEGVARTYQGKAVSSKEKPQYPFPLSQAERDIMAEGNPPEITPPPEGPEGYAAWAGQVRPVMDLARRGLRRQATEQARQALGRINLFEWLPDHHARTYGPQLQGIIREAMREDSRMDPLVAFRYIEKQLGRLVTGERPMAVQQRVRERLAFDKAEKAATQKEESDRQVKQVKLLTLDLRSAERKVADIDRRYDKLAKDVLMEKAERDKKMGDLERDREAAAKRVEEIEDRLRVTYGGKPAEPAATTQPAGWSIFGWRPGATAQPPRVTTQAEYDALPSGAAYVDPQGNQRRKK